MKRINTTHQQLHKAVESTRNVLHTHLQAQFHQTGLLKQSTKNWELTDQVSIEAKNPT